MRFVVRSASRSALMARALRHGVKPYLSPGRLRTHFPSGPSSRPVPGVQVDARCLVGGSRTLNSRSSRFGSPLLSGPRPYCPFLPGTEEPTRDPLHVASRLSLVGRPARNLPSPHRLGRALERVASLTEPARPRRFAPRWPPRPARLSGPGLGRPASLLGAASLCRPPLRVSDVHRQPTRPVLKHGPRSPGRSRVVGAPLTNPGGVAKARERVGGHRSGEVFRRSRPRDGVRGSLRSPSLAASEPCPSLPARRVLVYFPSSAPRSLSSLSSSDFPLAGR